MYKKLAGLIGVLIITLATSMAQSAVIYDNGGPLQPCNQGSICGWVSDSGSLAGNEVADDFILIPGKNTISDIHWWGAYRQTDAPSDPDDFTIRIYEDENGVPAEIATITIAVGSVERKNTGSQIFSAALQDYVDLYSYQVIIDPLTLASGQEFWLSIQNATTANVTDWGWAVHGVEAGNAAYRFAATSTWNSFASNSALAFYLTVPEPTTLALLGLGLAGIGYQRRRNKKAA